LTHVRSAGLRCQRAWTKYDYAHTLTACRRKQIPSQRVRWVCCRHRPGRARRVIICPDPNRRRSTHQCVSAHMSNWHTIRLIFLWAPIFSPTAAHPTSVKYLYPNPVEFYPLMPYHLRERAVKKISNMTTRTFCTFHEYLDSLSVTVRERERITQKTRRGK
jgi:hypothetical protein